MMYNILLFLIILIAAFDQYCLVGYVDYESELNPIGKLLIALGGIELFSAAKLMGVAITIWILATYKHIRVVKIAIWTVAIFQLWLFYFMLFS